MTESFWEQRLEQLRNSHTLETASLEPLDLATQDKVSNKDLAYNARIHLFRTDLGNKVQLTAINKSRELILQGFQEENQKLHKKLQACKVQIIQQAAEIRGLKEVQDITLQEVLGLKESLIQRRPLSKKDVEELVSRISEQPKFIEQQTEALTKELSLKVDKVEALIHRLEKSLVGL